MTAHNQSGPVDGLVFDYIRVLLDEQNRPLCVDDISELLDFPAGAVRRVVDAAYGAGRLQMRNGFYSLPGGAR